MPKLQIGPYPSESIQRQWTIFHYKHALKVEGDACWLTLQKTNLELKNDAKNCIITKESQSVVIVKVPSGDQIDQSSNPYPIVSLLSDCGPVSIIQSNLLHNC